jgi:uncharacterized protein (TIGR02284 family)
MTRPKIQGIDRPSEETLNEMIALCHDAEEHSRRAAEIVGEKLFSQFLTATGVSYAETISILEQMVRNKNGQESDPEGTIAGATDQLFAFVSAAASKETSRIILEQYQKALTRVLVGLEAACAEGTISKSKLEILLPRVALHEQQLKHLKKMLRDLT